ncbi:ATP-dependent DNA ligase [bacterium]|nr:ATP-dependent DNA ligase [bacterium]
MKFSEFAMVLEEVEQTSSRLEMTRLLAGIFEEMSADEIKIASYVLGGDLNPPYVGTIFGIAEKGMKQLLETELEIDVADFNAAVKNLGDLGLVFEAYKDETQRVNYTLEDVYDKLKEIEATVGTGSQERKAELFTQLLHDVDGRAGKYLVRIVIGKLRLGVSDMTIIDALSWMIIGGKSLRTKIEDAYNKSADIGFVAHMLKTSGIKSLEKISVTPGVPVRPAAAERLKSIEDILKKLGPCVGQPKLDGFRLQVHKFHDNGDVKVKFFSRNLREMSEMFPELREAVIKLPECDFIAEGEAIAFDEATGTFQPFQQTVKRRRKHGVSEVSEELPLRLYFFDVLHKGGRSLLEHSHTDRRSALEKLVPRKHEGVLHVIEEWKFEDAAELRKKFHAVMDDGLEGIVLKKPESLYAAGKRNFNWIKLKRDEGAKLLDSIDCVILGYYPGKGRRARLGIGALLVGIFDPESETFQSVAKVGTGVTDDQLKDLKAECDKNSVQNQPKSFDVAKELFPDVWVAPTMVCEVLADEITRSPLHRATSKDDQLPGLALRFPRFIQIRHDKGPRDATTSEELKSMMS